MAGNSKIPAIVIGAVYFVACAVMTWKAASGEFGLFVLLVTSIAAAPIAVGAWIGRILKTESIAILFYLSIFLIAIWGYYEIWRTLFVLPPDAQSSIAFLIGPFYQGVLVGLAALVAYTLDRRLNPND